MKKILNKDNKVHKFHFKYLQKQQIKNNFINKKAGINLLLS